MTSVSRRLSLLRISGGSEAFSFAFKLLELLFILVRLGFILGFPASVELELKYVVIVVGDSADVFAKQLSWCFELG